MRQLLDQMYTYLRKANVNVGYLKEGGYLPRMLDDVAVYENEAEFLADAGRAYEIVFTNEIGEFDGSVEQFEGIVARLKPDTRANLDEEILKQIDDLRKALKDDDVDALPNDVLNEIYDAVKAAEAEARANNWFLNIGLSMSGDTMTGSVTADFTKQRAPTRSRSNSETLLYRQPYCCRSKYISALLARQNTIVLSAFIVFRRGRAT